MLTCSRVRVCAFMQVDDMLDAAPLTSSAGYACVAAVMPFL
jgi:hypothetical protein